MQSEHQSPALKTKVGNIEVKRMFGKYFSAGMSIMRQKEIYKKSQFCS